MTHQASDDKVLKVFIESKNVAPLFNRFHGRFNEFGDNQDRPFCEDLFSFESVNPSYVYWVRYDASCSLDAGR